ncbi:type II toxin-antitoxin system VapB family antitoxin [Haloechinothrix halophila]|uniref:type II toxin-antitoxin system VapB family antitoxin n=1 Tax=Haloechinothrix halophila TaxID=1069073 RepID=UPI000408CE85|nr:ribbon-helix-helix protein, CopG family [Haloechinothrix halophila]
MSDFLVRDVPEDVLAAIDAHAARLGVSRNEYVRRELSHVAQRSASPVTTDDLRQFADAFSDLTDVDLMERAWE